MQATANRTDLVLASASPRRQQLLRAAGVAFEAVSPPIEEPMPHSHSGSPQQLAEALAYFKARTVAQVLSGRTVLAADTVVASPDGTIIGKPADVNEARNMLSSLSNSRHAVVTGVTLLGSGGRRLIASDTTYVTMREMTPVELQDYLDSQEWVGKAGAYAIQETADRFVQALDGSFTNVVGLPMELVQRMLRICQGPSVDC